MTKYLKTFFLFAASIFVVASCSKTKTYEDYLKEERENISKYISANNISVQNFKPTGDGEWKTADGRDIYFQSPSGLYFHQIELGEGTVEPVVGYTALVRYIGTTLSGVQVYNCTPMYAPDPESFEISSNASGKKFGIGFQEAVRYLRVGGHCKTILPFNAGNSAEAYNYTPMVYEIWLVGLE